MKIVWVLVLVAGVVLAGGCGSADNSAQPVKSSSTTTIKSSQVVSQDVVVQ